MSPESRNAALPSRLNVVTLGVHDMPRVRAFYERLGWHAHSVGDEWCRFDLGGTTLALFGLERLADEAALPPPPDGAWMKGFTLAICVHEENAVDEAMRLVQTAGGRVLAKPRGRDWGGRSGYFADPEGNAWEVAWLPDAAFDARGVMVWPSAD